MIKRNGNKQQYSNVSTDITPGSKKVLTLGDNNVLEYIGTQYLTNYFFDSAIYREAEDINNIISVGSNEDFILLKIQLTNKYYLGRKLGTQVQLENSRIYLVNTDSYIDIEGNQDFNSIGYEFWEVTELIGPATLELGKNYLFGYWLRGAGSYTNSNPSVIAVGGIPEGTTFNGTNFSAFVDMLLYPELFPNLNNPYNSFTSTETGLYVIGETLVEIGFTSTFNRGSIDPSYGTSGFRSGLPTKHDYIGTGLTDKETGDLVDNQTINNYIVLMGNQIWGVKVEYSGGEQPKGSNDSDFNNPLSAGVTSNKTVKIEGVYPLYATTNNITTPTVQGLVSMVSGNNIIKDLVPENGGSKQSFDIPQGWLDNRPLSSIQLFNTVSNQFDTTNQLSTFSITTVTHTIEGEVVNYKRYTNNSSDRGEIKIKLIF